MGGGGDRSKIQESERGIASESETEIEIAHREATVDEGRRSSVE